MLESLKVYEEIIEKMEETRQTSDIEELLQIDKSWKRVTTKKIYMMVLEMQNYQKHIKN